MEDLGSLKVSAHTLDQQAGIIQADAEILILHPRDLNTHEQLMLQLDDISGGMPYAGPVRRIPGILGTNALVAAVEGEIDLCRTDYGDHFALYLSFS